jgi:hypothetical protein
LSSIDRNGPVKASQNVFKHPAHRRRKGCEKMQEKTSAVARTESSPDENAQREIERTNAKMRHFRGVAAGVLNDAFLLWEEIWEVCKDPRTCEEILEGLEEPADRLPACGWPEFRKKMDLLRHYIDYTKRLCDGSF